MIDAGGGREGSGLSDSPPEGEEKVAVDARIKRTIAVGLGNGRVTSERSVD